MSDTSHKEIHPRITLFMETLGFDGRESAPLHVLQCDPRVIQGHPLREPKRCSHDYLYGRFSTDGGAWTVRSSSCVEFKPLFSSTRIVYLPGGSCVEDRYGHPEVDPHEEMILRQVNAPQWKDSVRRPSIGWDMESTVSTYVSILSEWAIHVFADCKRIQPVAGLGGFPMPVLPGADFVDKLNAVPLPGPGEVVVTKNYRPKVGDGSGSGYILDTDRDNIVGTRWQIW